MSYTLDITALFNSHNRELAGYLTKIVKCSEIAAEIVQESYLILSQTAKSQPIRHPRGLLFRVATNLAFNHLKHKKIVEIHAQHQITSFKLETPSAEHEYSQHQDLEMFCRIVEELPSRCRDVFILYKIHNMSYREIAAELGISESGVEKHIAKGMSYCRQKLLALRD
ncbi:MAG: sigma-70 family RNA polymerase sigma factor [Methylococcaceae bacterium]